MAAFEMSLCTLFSLEHFLLSELPLLYSLDSKTQQFLYLGNLLQLVWLFLKEQVAHKMLFNLLALLYFTAKKS